MKPAPSDTALKKLARSTGNLPFFSSLRVRLILLVLLAVLPALGLVIYTAIDQRRQGIVAAKEDALRLVRMAANNQDQLIEGARQLLVTLAQLNEVKSQNAEACQNIFTNLLRLHPVYANIGAVRPDGELFASGVTVTNGINISDRPYFQNAVRSGNLTIGDYQIDRITRKATVNIGYPALDQEKSLRAVVFAAVDLGWLDHMATNANLPDGSTLTVVDRRGKILIRYPSPEKYVGQSLPIPVRPVIRTSSIELPLSREGNFQARGMDGVWRLYAITTLGRRVEARPVIITVGIPLSEAYAVANRMLRRNLGFLGGVSALALAAAWFGGSFFVLRRVRSLLSATKRLSEGDLTVRTGVSTGTGELHQLARAFDEMAASLEQRVAERQRAEDQLQSLNDELEQRVADRTRELERSNQDLEQFAYVASHDMQEPLRMVTNYLQLLRQRYKGKLDNNAEEFIGFALDGAERMQGLILDLLAYSRVGTQGKEFEPADCNEIFERARKNLKVAIEESKAIVTTEPLPTVLGDHVQLLQLFQNLIGNAIKFRSQMPPVIHLRAEKKGDEWLFSVRDNGLGIEPKDFERIFVIFQRLHSRDKYPGTGIGLSVCKKIVERHGGRIWVESEAHKGTTFYFTLPALS
jgi:signal transduction histidine kinase